MVSRIDLYDGEDEWGLSNGLYDDDEDDMNDAVNGVDTQPTPEQEQDARLNAEAEKLGITLVQLKERIMLVNNASNTFGQLVMQLTDGDFDVALSIAGTFLASTLAQTALAGGKDPEAIWAFVSPGISDTARVLYAAFKEADELQRAVVGETVEGVASYPTNGSDTPKVG